MKKMTGTFTVLGASAHTVQVTQRENFLVVTIDEQASFRLYPTSLNQFQVSSENEGTLVFNPDANGALNQLALTIEGETAVATRVQ
jgi:hypothetical protein